VYLGKSNCYILIIFTEIQEFILRVYFTKCFVKLFGNSNVPLRNPHRRGLQDETYDIANDISNNILKKFIPQVPNGLTIDNNM